MLRPLAQKSSNDMRKRRSRTDLYQVDFIAALFGAFLLLWSAKKSGIATGGTVRHVVILESSCTADDNAAILPKTAISRCASRDTATEAGLRPCSSSSFSTADYETSKEIVDATPRDNERLTAVVAEMRLDSKEARDVVRLSGMAVSASGRFPVAIGYGSSTPPATLIITKKIDGAVVAEGMVLSLKKYSRRRHTFQVMLRSDAWPERCLKTKEPVVANTEKESSYTLVPCDAK